MSKTNNVLLRNEINPKDTWDLAHLYDNDDVYEQEYKNNQLFSYAYINFK